MKKVAITGNIGSGKSWVCQLFTRHLDIPVYGSDEAAKRYAQYKHMEASQKTGD